MIPTKTHNNCLKVTKISVTEKSEYWLKLKNIINLNARNAVYIVARRNIFG